MAQAYVWRNVPDPGRRGGGILSEICLIFWPFRHTDTDIFLSIKHFNFFFLHKVGGARDLSRY